MALPTLDSVFASAADVPRRYMLAQWLVNELGSGAIADYITLPERYLWAKIAVAAGAPRGEADYISLPKQYVWKAIYDVVSGSSLGTIDWSEKQALGHIAAAYRGDTGNPANLATYINWPWRYQVASIIIYTSTDSDVLAFIAASGATDIEGLDAFVKGVKNLGLWESMVAWPLRSSQNAGTGTTAYSLGGLGTFDGTLTNGPTWGADGLTFLVASAQGVSATVGNLSLPEQTLFGVSKVASAANGSIIIARNSTGGTQNGMNLRNADFAVDISAIQQSGGSTNVSVSWANSTDFFAYASAANTTNARLKRFPSTESANTALLHSGNLTNTDPLWIGRRAAAAGTADNTVAFAAMFTKDARSNWDQLYDLYKTTLGQSLGLP
jgi:hypothetical protein